MTDEVKPTPEGEVKTPAEVPTEEKKEQSVGEIITPKKEPEVVGLDKFLEVKKENKDLRKSIKDLEDRINSGISPKEISADIRALAKEHDVSEDFLEKLATTIEAQTEKRLDEKVSQRLKPIEEREQREKIDKAFDKHYAQALEKLPEYAEVINPSVIKALSLDPANKDKTFTEIIEETYGKAVGGRRTIESTIPRGGKEPTEIDFEKARRDGDYFKEIMADPDLKKKYNSDIQNRIAL